MIAIFKPMLAWLMDRTTLVCWLFVCIVGLGYSRSSTRLGGEFMPPLGERAVLDMPTNQCPRTSVAQATPELKGATRCLEASRGLAGGRQGGPRLRRPPIPRPSTWSRRSSTFTTERFVGPKLKFEDALIQTQAVLDSCEAEGIVKQAAPTEDGDAALGAKPWPWKS